LGPFPVIDDESAQVDSSECPGVHTGVGCDFDQGLQATVWPDVPWDRDQLLRSTVGQDLRRPLGSGQRAHPGSSGARNDDDVATLVSHGIPLDQTVIRPVSSLLFGMVLLGMSFSDRFAEKIVSLENPLIAPNMIGRYEIWKQSLEIVKDRPLLGIGLKTYGLPQVTQKYQLESSSHAHNMFLNVAAELGLTGLIALTVWLMFYFKTIVRMYPGMRSELNQGLWLGGLGCFVVLMVGGITHSMLGSESSLMLMTVLGLMFAGFRVESKESHLISRYLYKLAGCARTGHQSAAAVR